MRCISVAVNAVLGTRQACEVWQLVDLQLHVNVLCVIHRPVHAMHNCGSREQYGISDWPTTASADIFAYYSRDSGTANRLDARLDTRGSMGRQLAVQAAEAQGTSSRRYASSETSMTVRVRPRNRCACHAWQHQMPG